MKGFPNLGLAVSVAVAAMVAAGWVLWHPKDSGSSADAEISSSSPSTVRPADPANRPVTARQAAPAASGIKPLQGSIESQVSMLEDLAWRDDEESLNTITSLLSSPEPAVRQEALAAARTFGSRKAIPALRAAAARSADPTEQAALEETAEYLEMPTLLETVDRSNADDQQMGDE